MIPEAEEKLATTLYFDKTFGLDAAKVLPGEYYVTRRPMVIVTVLGSCVAACIRDKESGVGGMNHFMLPDGAGPSKASAVSMRYGAYAMDTLIDQLLKAGARRENLEAKVFGGGNVLSGFTTISVGERNAQFARDYLQAKRIRILAEDLNDVHPRKVYFFPESGKVLVKRLKQMGNDTVLQRELDYASRLKKLED